MNSGDESDSENENEKADVVEDNLSDDDESNTYIYNSESSSDDDVEENSCGGNNGVTVKTRRDDVKWTIALTVEVTGRFQTQNVFTAKSGRTSYCRNVLTPIDALRLIMDEGFTRFIKKCTALSANLSNEGWNISDIELDAFIGLIYLRGCMNARNFQLNNSYGLKNMATKLLQKLCRVLGLKTLDLIYVQNIESSSKEINLLLGHGC
nr:uncharacterized protein LOC124816968 [Hydra vulgaris]